MADIGPHCTVAGSGLFTSTNPELRRVKPDNVGNRAVVKVVYVVLEAQYQSAVSNAVKNINSKNSKVRGEACSRLKQSIKRASTERT